MVSFRDLTEQQQLDVLVSYHDKVEELKQQLAAKDAEIDRLNRIKSRTRQVEIEQQLAAKAKQVVMLREFVKLLRDYIPASAVGNMTVQQALDITEKDAS